MRRHLPIARKHPTLIGIAWGKPLSFVISPQGDIQEISTVEQAHDRLKGKWPVADHARDHALHQIQIEAVLDCLALVGTARRAFISAARTAGFLPKA